MTYKIIELKPGRFESVVFYDDTEHTHYELLRFNAFTWYALNSLQDGLTKLPDAEIFEKLYIEAKKNPVRMPTP